MEREWRCKNCNTRLGIECGSRLHLRYKDAQYIVDGGDYTVIAICRNCSTLSERRGTKEPPQPIAASK